MADIHELAAAYREHYETRSFDNPNEQHSEIYQTVRIELTGCVGRLFRNESAKGRLFRVPRPLFGRGPMFSYSYAKKRILAGDDYNGMLQVWMGEYTYSWRMVPRPSPTTPRYDATWPVSRAVESALAAVLPPGTPLSGEDATEALTVLLNTLLDSGVSVRNLAAEMGEASYGDDPDNLNNLLVQHLDDKHDVWIAAMDGHGEWQTFPG